MFCLCPNSYQDEGLGSYYENPEFKTYTSAAINTPIKKAERCSACTVDP